MNRSEFLRQCVETGLMLHSVADIGAWIQPKKRFVETWVRDAILLWQRDLHESAKFLEVPRKFYTTGPTHRVAPAVLKAIADSDKKGFVARLEIPVRIHRGKRFTYAVTVYTQVIYADSMEELWDLAVSVAKDYNRVDEAA